MNLICTKYDGCEKCLDFCRELCWCLSGQPPPRRRSLSTSVKYVLTHVVSRCLLPRVERPTLSFLIELKPARQLIWRWLRMISHKLIKAPASNRTLCFYGNDALGYAAKFSRSLSFLSFSFLHCAGWARPHRETQGSHVRPACREEVADLLQQEEGRSITAAGCRLAANV